MLRRSRRAVPGCSSKRCFATWVEAETEALWLAESDDAYRRQYGAPVTYRCLSCRWWHVGHWNLNRTPLDTARLKGLI